MRADHIARFDRSYMPEPMSGCWLWTAYCDQNGYGIFGRHGHKHQKAHRASWTIHKGGIPDGMKICHKCDVRSCVNPDHLFLGTQADNVADMIAKGRFRHTTLYGEDNPRSKFTAEIVSDVRKRAAAGEPQRRIAASIGMSPMNVSRIVRRQLWVDLP